MVAVAEWVCLSCNNSLSVRAKSGCLYRPTLHRFIVLLKMTGTFLRHCCCWLGMPKSIDPVVPTCSEIRDNLIPEYLSASPVPPPWKLQTLSLKYSHSSFERILSVNRFLQVSFDNQLEEGGISMTASIHSSIKFIIGEIIRSGYRLLSSSSSSTSNRHQPGWHLCGIDNAEGLTSAL